MKERRVRVKPCTDCIETCQDNPQFCKYIITSDSPSCFGTILKPNLRARSGEEENLYWKPKSFPCGTRILINLLRNTEWCTMNLYQNEQRWRVNYMQRSWKGHWREFREWGLKFERKEFRSFSRQCPAHPAVTMKPGECQRRDQPATQHNWYRFSRSFLFTKAKITINGTFQDLEDIRRR